MQMPAEKKARARRKMMELDPEKPGLLDSINGEAGTAMMIYARVSSTIVAFLIALALFTVIQ
jgi:hypothetical protein